MPSIAAQHSTAQRILKCALGTELRVALTG